MRDSLLPQFRPRRPGRRATLAFEQLEAREVPATFYVTDPGDNGGVNPAPYAGTGTLRQAVVDAQQVLADGDTIVITLGVGAIELEAPLPVFVETHTIRAEVFDPGVDTVAISPAAGLENTFRFATVVPNGSVFTMENVSLSFFGAVADGTTGSGNGGAIRADGDVILRDCSISNCTATGNGGAIAANMSVTLNDCAFFMNTAEGNGGAIWSVSTSVPYWRITDSGFTMNTAEGSGGAIFSQTADTGQLIIRETLFTGNYAIYGDGGAICQLGGRLDVIGTPTIGFPGGFIANFAGGRGGGVYIFMPSFLNFDVFTGGNLAFVPPPGVPGTPILNGLWYEYPVPGATILINLNLITDGVVGIW